MITLGSLSRSVHLDFHTQMYTPTVLLYTSSVHYTLTQTIFGHGGTLFINTLHSDKRLVMDGTVSIGYDFPSFRSPFGFCPLRNPCDVLLADSFRSTGPDRPVAVAGGEESLVVRHDPR